MDQDKYDKSQVYNLGGNPDSVLAALLAAKGPAVAALNAQQNLAPPFYTIHKIMAGMFDMYSLAGNRQALEVLEGMAAWADEWTAPKNAEHMQQILTIELCRESGGPARRPAHAGTRPVWTSAVRLPSTV